MSVEYRAIYTGQEELKHHGILGQKWGVRRYQYENGVYTKEGLERRKKINTALAVAGGIGANVGVTLGSGNPLAGKIAGGATAAVIKSSLDSRAEQKGKKRKKSNTSDNEPDALDKYYTSEEGKEELRNYSKQNTVEKTKAARDKAYNKLVNDVKDAMDDTYDSNLKDTLIWFADSDKPKVIADKLIRAEKNLNEYMDPDCSVFQQMPSEAMEGYSRGYLSKKQFDNIYDKEVIDTVSEYRVGDIDIMGIMKDAVHIKIGENENRFTSYFGNGPANPESLKHYFYTSNVLYV